MNPEAGEDGTEVFLPVPCYEKRADLPTFQVMSDTEVFLVTLAYEVRSVSEFIALPSPRTVIRTAARLRVLGKDENEVAMKTVFTGVTRTNADGSWAHTVSCSAVLSNLASGAYSLLAYEYTESGGEREFRDMRLLVVKMA